MRTYLVAVSLVPAVALASALGCSSSSGGGGSGGDASTGGGSSGGSSSSSSGGSSGSSSSGGGSSSGSVGPGCMAVIALEDGGPPESCLWSAASTCTSTRVPGHCPSAGLFGCCVLSPMGYTQATCDYGDGGELGNRIAMGNCEDAGNTWQTTVP